MKILLQPPQGHDEAAASPGAQLEIHMPLSVLPAGILSLGAILEHLDLSGSGLSALPQTFGAALPRLRVAFFTKCNFASFPAELAACPRLDSVSFSGNAMTTVPAGALPRLLRYLDLTDNRITGLPSDIGRCSRLEKCMISGNYITSLPDEMAACENLALLRVAALRLGRMPPWVWDMPRLSSIAFAGNPCVRSPPSFLTTMTTTTTTTTMTTTTTTATTATTTGSKDAAVVNSHTSVDRHLIPSIQWADLTVQRMLSPGGSRFVAQALWRRPPPHSGQDVAVKVFCARVGSDGYPDDEIAAWLAAGSHENLVGILGFITGQPDEEEEEEEKGPEERGQIRGGFHGGLVMRLIPPNYSDLGNRPTLETCTRGVFPGPGDRAGGDAAAADGTRLAAAPLMSLDRALSILTGVADACAHLHARGIAHGDVCAHNIMVETDGPHALLTDLGSATVYGDGPGGVHGGVERLEMLGFAHLIEDVLGLMGQGGGGSSGKRGKDSDEGGEGPATAAVVAKLRLLHAQCSALPVKTRPAFAEIAKKLQGIARWRRKVNDEAA